MGVAVNVGKGVRVGVGVGGSTMSNNAASRPAVGLAVGVAVRLTIGWGVTWSDWVGSTTGDGDGKVITAGSAPGKLLSPSGGVGVGKMSSLSLVGSTATGLDSTTPVVRVGE